MHIIMHNLLLLLWYICKKSIKIVGDFKFGAQPEITGAIQAVVREISFTCWLSIWLIFDTELQI